MLMSRAFRTAFNLSLPVLGAYWFLGITYGLLAANMGYSVWIPISMALCVYSGSVEFIALTLLLGTFQPLSAFVMAFMVAAGAVCFYLFGPQQFIIPTMLCILAVLFVNYKQHNP